MHIVHGELWNELDKAGLILVTTNSFVKNNGELVMGRGAAKQAALRFPKLPRSLGERVERSPTFGSNLYGVVVIGGAEVDCPVDIGAFQVKYHWGDPASMSLIRISCEVFCRSAYDYNRIAMNFPGIGYGHLSESQVLPVLQSLPDNVYVYKKDGES